MFVILLFFETNIRVAVWLCGVVKYHNLNRNISLCLEKQLSNYKINTYRNKKIGLRIEDVHS